MSNLKSLLRWNPTARQWLNWTITIVSAIACVILLPARLPGMELLGIGPNWPLIWVVAWSIKRTTLQGAFAGLVLGLLQDGMTSPHPTHALSLIVVGALTGHFQKQRYIQEDFISIALIAFGMAIVAETVLAVQFHLAGDRTLTDIWMDNQRIALSSAILSSLWAPVIYFPLSRWWQLVNSYEQSQT
ncbi:MAG: rod shape-determining protein MreD [Desertifilum sp. SIO1I2]|nr:rod shape-determining protein MreD [Desertifilum sp. SIO1I2]